MLFLNRVQFQTDVEMLVVDGGLHVAYLGMKFGLREPLMLDGSLHAVNGVVGLLQVGVCNRVSLR